MSRPRRLPADDRALSYEQCARRCPRKPDGSPRSARWFRDQVATNLQLRSGRIVIAGHPAILRSYFVPWLHGHKTTKPVASGAAGRAKGAAALAARRLAVPA